MTASVVGAIAPKLEQAEIERAKRKEALSWAETAIRAKSDHLYFACIAAASAALAGRSEAARKAMMLVRQIDPQLRLSNLKEVISYLPSSLRQMGRGATTGRPA